jgi:hypothetical protein
VPIAKAVSSFSLALLLCAFGLAGQWGELHRRLQEAEEPAEIARILRQAETAESADPQFAKALEHWAKEPEDVRRQEQIVSLVELRASAESAQPALDAPEEARRIKSSILYRDPGEHETPNWLGGALERLIKLIPEFGGRAAPNVRMPTGIGNWLVYTMWALLGAAVLAFAFFAFRHFSFKRALRRKAGAILEEDEPERTLDEWLALAERLEAEGNFREAVRCLYLACLLKFDEHGVARFVRGQTNWEHLRRIQGSQKNPAGLDFHSPTKAFDRIWYGMRIRGAEDVGLFREWYGDVTRSLQGGKA